MGLKNHLITCDTTTTITIYGPYLQVLNSIFKRLLLPLLLYGLRLGSIASLSLIKHLPTQYIKPLRGGGLLQVIKGQGAGPGLGISITYPCKNRLVIINVKQKKL